MNREDMFEAIGMMDEVFLKESLAVQGEKPKRILWKTVLVAAIVACLSITAVAAVITELKGRTNTERRVHIRRSGMEREELDTHMLDIYVAFPELSDAPTEIDEFYAPTIFEKEKLYFCGINEGNSIREFYIRWDLPDVREDASGGTIWFFQRCCDDYDPEQPIDTLVGEYTNTSIHSEKLLWDGREYFFVSLEPWQDESLELENTNYLYWTDGDYLFKLNFPYSMEAAEAMEIVGSVEKVSDIQLWLDIGKEKQQDKIDERWTKYLAELSSEEPYRSAKSVVSGKTQVTEDGDLEVLVEFSTSTKFAEWVERLIYPRYFEDHPIERMDYSSSSINMQFPENKLVDYTVYWKVPEYGEGEEVWFRQKGRYGDPASLTATQQTFYIFDMDNTETAHSRMIEWDEDTFFEVSFENGKDGASGARYLFWTDGAYAFCLRCPYAMEDAEIQKIVESIR